MKSLTACIRHYYTIHTHQTQSLDTYRKSGVFYHDWLMHIIAVVGSDIAPVRTQMPVSYLQAIARHYVGRECFKPQEIPLVLLDTARYYGFMLPPCLGRLSEGVLSPKYWESYFNGPARRVLALSKLKG
jgi:hypothetical protein